MVHLKAVYLGGVWHIQTRPFGIIVRGFTWSGEAYLSYTLSGGILNGTEYSTPSLVKDYARKAQSPAPTDLNYNHGWQSLDLIW